MLNASSVKNLGFVQFISKKCLIIFGIWYFFAKVIWAQDVAGTGDVSITKEIAPPPNEALIEADYIAYDSEKNIIVAVGNIVAKINREIKINCDNMQVSVNERKLQAQGNITINALDKGHVTPLQGDDLFYDIQLSQGRIIRVEPNLEKIHFQGADLKIISSILGEKQKDYRTDLEKSSLVLVCKKILFVFGDKMEAHQVSVWSKGIKVLSVPYYSTDFEIEFPDIPIAVRKIDYDSRDRLRYSLVLNYTKHKKYTGKMNFEYQQRKGKEKDVWKANLTQQFTLGKQKGGTISVSNIGERDYSVLVNYNHYLGKNLQINPTLLYRRDFISGSKKSSKSRGISLSRRFLHSSFLASYNESGSSYAARDRTTTVKLNWQRYPKFIEKTKLSYSTEVAWDYQKIGKSSNSGITTNLNLLRSGLYILPKLYLDLNTSLSQVMSEDRGSSSFHTSFASHYLRERRWGRAVLSARYSVSSSRQDLGFGSRSRTLNINTSFSRKMKWTARAGMDYDARKKEWLDTIYPNLDIRINRLLRVNITGNYSCEKDEFKSANLSVFYNLFGERDPRYLYGRFDWGKYNKPKTSYYITFVSSI